MQEEDWIKAGKIAAQVLNYGKNMIKPEASMLEITKKIEEKTFSLGAKMAFPVNISINHVAAHHSALFNDDAKFKQGELVKLDIGVHVNGAIGDNAATIDLGDNKELVNASKEALNEGVKLAKPGTKLHEIGYAIQEKIKEYGFAPVINLSGHLIDEYTVHAGTTIPNYDNGDDNELEEGQVIAIEPFATNGEGKVIEGKLSNIYRLEAIRQVRHPLARKILTFIEEEYKTLPFAKRWVLEKFDRSIFAFRMLETQKLLHRYPELVEKGRGLVSQAEHTILVGKGVITKEE